MLSPQFDKNEQPRAAVAIIEIKGPDPEYLLLQRAINPLDPWSGHLALPGGRCETHDCDLIQTSIRETEEECGIRLERGNLVKSIPWLAAGNATGLPILVAPFHFRLHSRPRITLQAEEMEKHLWLKSSSLWDAQTCGEGPLSPLHPDMRFPFVQVEGERLWGFTLKVLWQVCGRTPGFFDSQEDV